MRKAWIVAGLACSLYAADLSIDGPRTGYISSPAGIRGVLGILGASRLGAPVTTSLQNVTVLPGQDLAVGTTPDGELVRLNLLDGSSTSLGIQKVSRIAVSSSGETLLALSEGRAVLLSKDGAKIADRDLPGEPLLLAIADTGKTAAMTIAEGDGEALYILSGDSSRLMFGTPRIPSMAFISGSSDVVMADGAGTIFRLNADQQFWPISNVPGLTALAATAERVVAAAGGIIRSIPLRGGRGDFG